MNAVNTVEIEESKWLHGLQSFINKLLTPIIVKPVERNKYLVSEAMKVWATAFTHETFSSVDNYEDLEYLGDAILKSVFPDYLMRRMPSNFHKGEFTELNVAYMSKLTNAALSRKMKLPEYIRVLGIDRANLSLEGDVFESFFGALFTISDMIVRGLGYSVCYKMVVHLFNDIDIDESKAQGSAKTQVIQMFVRFDLPQPQEQASTRQITVTYTEGQTTLRSGIIGYSTASKKKTAENEAYGEALKKMQQHGMVTITETQAKGRKTVDFSIILRPKHIEFLRSYNIDIRNPVIGQATAKTKKEAEAEAYNQALITLSSYGITTEWAEEAKTARDFSDPVIGNYAKPAADRLVSEGFIKMYFFIPRKTVTPDGAVVQLVGIRANGKREVLSYTYTTDRENSYQMPKAYVLQQYINKPPSGTIYQPNPLPLQ